MNRPKEARSTQSLRFLTTAVNLEGCPDDLCPEIAVVGRSNAGKSTLINGLAGAKIALVSSTPGKTRHLNFYQGKAYRLVDMPGYGFSARSGDEQSSWQEMIEPFLGARENLQGLMIVMDIRRDWSADEEDLLKWLSPRELPFAVVATKADKMSRSQALNRVRDIKKQSRAEHVMMTSSLQKKGYLEIEEFMFHSWIKPGDPSADEAGDET